MLMLQKRNTFLKSKHFLTRWKWESNKRTRQKQRNNNEKASDKSYYEKLEEKSKCYKLYTPQNNYLIQIYIQREHN